MASKTADPRWSVPQPAVDPQLYSRFGDPYDPDRPPLPPDDPVAHQDMHSPGGMRGYRHWHDDGDAAGIENPFWRESLELAEDGSFALTRDRAVEMALINSREYQTELEDLYLACLALTLERFEFDLQWYLLSSPNFFHFGSSPGEINSLSTPTSFGFRKVFASGGQMLVDFSNSFVWQYTGSDSVTVRSNIGVDLVQPLLRNAGRNIRLEALTQAERNVLYAARDFARFRKQFYFDVVSGNVGYLALLARVQNIRNFESNVSSLLQDLNAHHALFEAGIASRLQVDQVFQSYQTGRVTLVRAQNDLQNAMDAYKIRLGLPPDLPVTLDDSLLAPFQFTDPLVEQTEQELDALLARYRELSAPPDLPLLRRGYEELGVLHQRVVQLLRALPEQVERAKQLPPAAGAPQDREWHEYRLNTVREAEQRLIEMNTEVDKLLRDAQAGVADLAEDKRQQHWEALQRLIRRQLGVVSEMYVLQTRIRAYHIDLQEINLAPEMAIQIALMNRLDLLNQRARVVDSWRDIKITQNRLKGFLDLTVSADVGTDPDSNNPLDFSSSGSGYRAGLRFDGPLNRQAERNNYRAQLIVYQRLRRQYMALEDRVIQEVRRDLRELNANRINFEIARQSLITAARQVEEARDQLLIPGPASDSSRTQDTLNALNSLLQAKNALISIWVDYETTRVQLLLDLEALQPDPSLEPADFYFDPQAEAPSYELTAPPPPAVGPEVLGPPP